MNLNEPSQQNTDFMLKEITDKLKMVNSGVFEHVSVEAIHYEKLVELYQLIKRKNSFSTREMQLFAEELRLIRKD